MEEDLNDYWDLDITLLEEAKKRTREAQEKITEQRNSAIDNKKVLDLIVKNTMNNIEKGTVNTDKNKDTKKDEDNDDIDSITDKF